MLLPEFDIDDFESSPSALEYIESGDPVDPDETINFTTQFITGNAGSGKSFSIKQKIEADPSYGLLCATTGIAAINLNTTTINSVLKYFDTDSLRDNYVTGRLARTIKEIANTHQNIIIDEVSMMPGEQLDILFMAIRDYNRMAKKPFGIILLGDMLQLAPVKASWAFEAVCWPYFEANTTKLTKIWRQSDPKFLAAINLIREGKGNDGAVMLKEAGVVFAPAVDNHFEGTTIMAKNIEVDRFNQLRLMEVPGKTIAMPSYRWGQLSSEAKNIPAQLHLKEGALVMVLVNNSPNFDYVNGDLGIVKGHNESKKGITVELMRTGSEVTIPYITRSKVTLSATDANGKELSVDDVPHWSEWTTEGESKIKSMVDAPWGQVYYDPERERFIVGAVKYMPLRLAYATSCHKCVSADTKIPVMGKGYVPISHLVEQHDITPYGKVLACIRTSEPEVIIETNRGYQVKCSPQHKWETDRGLLETRDIAEGDKIKLAPYIPVSGRDLWTKESAWWLGMTVGDACVTDTDEGSIHMACMDQELGELWKDTTEQVWGHKPSWRSDRRGLHLTNKSFRQQLEWLGLSYAKGPDKTIPWSIWQEGTHIQAAFLSGLFDADGHIGTSRVVFTSASPTLLIEVQQMLLTLGIICLRKWYPNKYKGYGQLYVGRETLVDFCTRIGFSKQDKNARIIQEVRSKGRTLNPANGWDKIASVTPTGNIIEMYDVEIPSPHMLTFGPFLGHNSQGLSIDKLQLDPRSNFFGAPAMAYVALSRARTAEGLRIVGPPSLFGARVKMDEKVKRWM